MLRLILLLVGLFTLIGLVWHIGPSRILDMAAGLGVTALVVILLPSLLMYILEALGWRLTLGRHAATVPFWRLFLIRMAGEAVNMTTPTAYVGGEPLKAYLVKRGGVPMVDGLASVVTAKTTMTLAEVAFIFLGIAIGIGVLGTSGSTDSPAISLMAAIASVGLLLFGTVVFVLVQRRGLFMSALGMLRRCRIRIRFLEARESRLQELDRSILDFYIRDRWSFFLCFVTYFFGWLAEGLEVYAILYFLGLPADLPIAISIAALSVFIKGGTFFIPGSLGAQDGGNVLLLLAFGFTEVAGITFALLRRVRELIWIVIGLLSLAALGGRERVDPAGLEAAQ